MAATRGDRVRDPELSLRCVFIRPAYVFPDPIPFHEAGNDGIVSVGGATFQLRSLFVIALGLVLALPGRRT